MPGPIFFWLKGYEGAVFVERVLMEGEEKFESLGKRPPFRAASYLYRLVCIMNAIWDQSKVDLLN